MNIWRILNGKLSIMKYPWNRWCHLGYSRCWGGRIFMFEIAKWLIQLDCRVNLMEDIVSGRIK